MSSILCQRVCPSGSHMPREPPRRSSSLTIISRSRTDDQYRHMRVAKHHGGDHRVVLRSHVSRKRAAADVIARVICANREVTVIERQRHADGTVYLISRSSERRRRRRCHDVVVCSSRSSRSGTTACTGVVTVTTATTPRRSSRDRHGFGRALFSILESAEDGGGDLASSTP